MSQPRCTLSVHLWAFHPHKVSHDPGIAPGINVIAIGGMPPYLKFELLNRLIVVVYLGFLPLAARRKDRQGLV
jgi:hypothetical protein